MAGSKRDVKCGPLILTVSIDSKLKNTMLVIITISTDKNPSEYATESVLFQLGFVGLPRLKSSPWKILGEAISSFVPCWSSC